MEYNVKSNTKANSHEHNDGLKYRGMIDRSNLRQGRGYEARDAAFAERISVPVAVVALVQKQSYIQAPKQQRAKPQRLKLQLSKRLPKLPVRPKSYRKIGPVAILAVLLLGSFIMLFSDVAQAAVVLRASSTSTASDQIKLRGTNSNNNAGGSGSLALTMPTGTVQNDVMIVGLTIVGGTGTTVTTVPTGWTLLDIKRDSGTALTQVMYYKQAGAGESGSYTWNFTSNKASGVIMSYANCLTSGFIDTSNGQVNASNATITSPSVTTAVANEMLVGIYGTAVGTTIASGTMTVQAQDASTGAGAGSRTTTAGADLLIAAAGVTGTKTTTASAAAVNIGQVVALKPNTGTSLDLSKPTGTVQNDVMIAAITITGGSGVTFTAPSGWTSIQNTNTASNEIKTQSWYLVAGASEPASYTWTWTGGQRAAGAIMSYSGVDTASPIDQSGSQANASSTTITAPSISPTNEKDQLVAIFGIANAGTITPVSPLTTQAYSAPTGTSTLSATRLADQQLTANGATGTRTGTAGTAGVNVGQLVALKPSIATLSQASHRWFSQPSIQPGISWTSESTPVANNWQGITYGNGLFVTVANSGTGNRVMTSPDGENWTARASAGDKSWSKITYGNNIFVAVASDIGGSGAAGKVMTSPDGITWTSRTAAADNQWASVTYANGLFVAVSGSVTGNDAMTSPDGITWTVRTTPSPNGWSAVTYGNGFFVAVASRGTGDRVMTSPDGITWTSRTSAADNLWRAVLYGNGLFVAVGESGTGDRVMTSPDGITWTSRTNPLDNGWAGLAYGGGLFVATAYSGSGNMVMTSPDGITWTSRAAATNNQWQNVAYGNGIFVAVSIGGGYNRAMRSVNFTEATAATWTTRTSAADNSWNSIVYGNGLFVAVSNGGTGNNVMTSPDGIAWTSRTSAADSTWKSVTYGNGLFVAVSSTSGNVMTSPDGITWTLRTAATTNAWQSVTYGNGLFVAVSYDGTGNRVMTSPDGITWTSRTSGTDDAWSSVTYGNGIFVAVACGDNATVCNGTLSNANRVMTSPDGITWTARIANPQKPYKSVTYGNGLFVAVASGTVMTSPDGITWTSRTAAANIAWQSVTYANGLLVAVSTTGTGNRVMTSLDGITWTSRTSATDNNWSSVIYGNGLFVAVASTGTGDRVMTAPGIDADVGSALAAQDTSFANTTSDSVQLRMNLGVATKTWQAGDIAQSKLSLQYGLRTGGSCTGSETYYDVGTAAWVAQTTPADNSWTSVAYGNGLFVAVAASGIGNRVMTSPDGITWTTRTSAADNNWQSVTYGNGLFVAVSSTGGSRVMTSPDGITWTARTATALNTWQSVTYGNGLFVAVNSSSTGNRVMTSPDGITWTIQATPADYSWQAVTYGNGQFVAVAISGTGNRVMTSPDGISWTSRTPATDNSWIDVTYGNGLFVAVSYDGTGNRVMTSPDGISWTSRTSAADNSWYGVAYGNGQFAAVSTTGTGNRAMTMSPAVLWGGLTANNYGTATSNGSDPTQGASSIIRQQYVTNNNFTNYFDTTTSQYALFDFDLDLSKATYNNAYCFRAAYANGTALTSYSSYPEITRCTTPSLDARLRHGAAFCANTKRNFWSRAGV